MKTLTRIFVGYGLLLSFGTLSGCSSERVEETVESVTGMSEGDSSTSLRDGVVGTWELARVEFRDSTGEEISAPAPPGFGAPGAIGQAVLDDAGHIGVAIMQQNRTKGGELTPAEALADLEAYRGFFGTYSINENDGLMTVHFEGNRDPRLTGTSATDRVSVSGDQLMFNVSREPTGVQTRLVWNRLPDFEVLSDAHRRVVGFWHHIPNEGDTESDPPLRPGNIIYTAAGRMMVHLMDPVRETYTGEQPTGDEALATVNSYTSYFGPVTVEEAGSYFIHHRIGHTIDLTDRPKSERRTGLDTDAQRFYEFIDGAAYSGDRMVLRFLSTAGIDPPPVSEDADWGGMITWERLR
jgi:hypothetical protein